MNDRTEARVAHEIEASLRQDNRLSSQPLDVAVDDDRVVVSGAVQSHQRKLAALRIANEANDGVPVDDRIEVDTPPPRTDRDIVLDVRHQLRQAPGLPHEAIDVRLRNGRARLGGRVATQAQRVEASDLALAIPGVRTIRNLLLVDPEGLEEDVNQCHTLDRVVRDELGAVADGVDVSVTGSAANLMGIVPDTRSARRAQQVVRAAGMLRVRNRLITRPSAR